jgi:hypothetical protein
MLGREEGPLMLMALALLAAIDAVPSSTVALTRTGETDRPPVSAAPRSLSDIARELRAGRKAAGGFSAVESTVPQSLGVFVPIFEPEPDSPAAEPEVVIEAQPVYVPTYIPVWYGGCQKSGRLHHRTATHPVAPRAIPPNPGRLSAPSAFQLRHTMAGHSRQR